MNTQIARKLFLGTVVVSIINSQQPVLGVERRIPPPEAFAACVDKSEGAAVSFITRNDTLTAICRMFDGKLAAASDRNRNNAGGNAAQIKTQPTTTNQ